MDRRESPERAKRRNERRLRVLRARALLASALGFVAFVGLAAQHAVGSTKRAVNSASPEQAAAPARYFDQQGDGFAFDDGSAAASPPPPAVAQTNVS